MTDELEPRETAKWKARIAANELWAIVVDHEQSDHDGEPCMYERAGMVAFVAHTLGVTPQDLDLVADAIAVYAEHHGQ